MDVSGLGKGYMGAMTKEYIIAYFDILGYKDIVLNNRMPEEKIIAIVYRTIENIIKSKDFQKGLEVKTYFFSDNCAICYEKMDDVDYVNEIRLLIFTLQIIQRDLFCNFGILIRGAILEGELYLAENFIYGKGIIEAYNIENNYAIYPRIIVSTELVKNTFLKIKEIFLQEEYNPTKKLSVRNMFDLFRGWMANILIEDGVISKGEYNSVKREWENIKVCKDFDGYYFVDFLYSIMFDPENINDVLKKYKKEILLGLKKNIGDKKVINKYLWCVTYGNYYFYKCGNKRCLCKDEIEKIIGCKVKNVDGLLAIE